MICLKNAGSGDDKCQVSLPKRYHRHYLKTMALKYLVRIRGKCSIAGSKSPDRINSICATATENSPTETPNIGGSFRQSCARYADRVAVVDDRGMQSYAWLFRQACCIADALQRRSEFKPGHHVGLHLPNSPEYVAGFYGILLAGGVVVPLPSYHKPDRIRQLTELAGLDLLIDTLPSDNTATCSHPSLSNPQIILLNRTAATLPTESGRQHADDVAMMLFTSGSTGEPKAVMLSHRNVLANARSICSFLPIDADDRTLAIMPFAHAPETRFCRPISCRIAAHLQPRFTVPDGNPGRLAATSMHQSDGCSGSLRRIAAGRPRLGRCVSPLAIPGGGGRADGGSGSQRVGCRNRPG